MNYTILLRSSRF